MRETKWRQEEGEEKFEGRGLNRVINKFWRKEKCKMFASNCCMELSLIGIVFSPIQNSTEDME